MNREKKDKHFIKKPVYEGGPKALKAFISSQLHYPKEALKDKIEGTVSLKYSIGHNGKVTDVSIISGLSPECDAEAVRVVKLLEFQIPKQRKGKVLFHKNINIHFRLPRQKTPSRPSKPAPGIQYTYVSKKKSQSPDSKQPGDEKKEGGYNYIINY